MKETILIVEDQPEIRDLLTVAIEQDRRYAVVAVEAGEEALQICRQQDIALVLLDLRLPGMPGLEVLERLRAMDENAVVVVMTGYASKENAVEAMKRGALEYVEKPFDVARVKGLVKRGVTLRQYFREQKEKTRRHTARMMVGVPAGNQSFLFQAAN